MVRADTSGDAPWWAKLREPQVWGRPASDLTVVFRDPSERGLLRPEADLRTLTVRPAWGHDYYRVEAVRRENRLWLQQWEATLPPGSADPPLTLSGYRRLMEQQMRSGDALVMIVEADRQAAGLVSLGAVSKGAMSLGNLGYWIGQRWARLGITSLAVAAAVDLIILELGLHRVEVNIRPENEASLAVARSLGLRHEGLRRRYMCIAGQWRDHQGFAVDREDLEAGGLVETRLLGRYSHWQ